MSGVDEVVRIGDVLRNEARRIKHQRQSDKRRENWAVRAAVYGGHCSRCGSTRLNQLVACYTIDETGTAPALRTTLRTIMPKQLAKDGWPVYKMVDDQMCRIFLLCRRCLREVRLTDGGEM